MKDHALTRLIGDLKAVDSGRLLTEVFWDEAVIDHYDYVRNVKDDGYVRQPDGTETVRRIQYDGAAELVVSYLRCEHLGVIHLSLPEGCPEPDGWQIRIVVEDTTQPDLVRQAIALFDERVADVNALSPKRPEDLGHTRSVRASVPSGIRDVFGEEVVGL